MRAAAGRYDCMLELFYQARDAWYDTKSGSTVKIVDYISY